MKLERNVQCSCWLQAHYSEEDLDSGVVLGDFEYVREGPWRQVFTLDPLVCWIYYFHTYFLVYRESVVIVQKSILRF